MIPQPPSPSPQPSSKRFHKIIRETILWLGGAFMVSVTGGMIWLLAGGADQLKSRFDKKIQSAVRERSSGVGSDSLSCTRNFVENLPLAMNGATIESTLPLKAGQFYRLQFRIPGQCVKDHTLALSVGTEDQALRPDVALRDENGDLALNVLGDGKPLRLALVPCTAGKRVPATHTQAKLFESHCRVGALAAANDEELGHVEPASAD